MDLIEFLKANMVLAVSGGLVIFIFFCLFFIIIFHMLNRASRVTQGIQSGVVPQTESQLRNDAQEALNAIKSKRYLSASYNRANRGQHVFNNGLLGFHRSVLQDLLSEVGGYHEQLDNLVQDLMIPLSQFEQHSISTMVAHFSSDEPYVDFNADVFGEYARELRTALVTYLMAETSANNNDRNGIQGMRMRVRFIAEEMVNHVVYVDLMARDRWLEQNQNHREDYSLVLRALTNMFQNILQDFKKVSDKIRVFRKRNKWTW